VSGAASPRDKAPFAQAFALDEARIRFVERSVAGEIELLMRELVEDHAVEAVGVAAQHARHDRIGEPAECRKRGDAFDRNVVASLGELCRIPFGERTVEPAAIRHATGEREAMHDGIDREFRRGEHTPAHVRPVERDELRVASVARQSEMVGCERACGLRLAQARPRARVGARVGDDALDRLALREQTRFAASDMRGVAQRRAAAQRRHEEDRKDGARSPHAATTRTVR
jgi:hypothetical protein